jgi:hypothetical protein
LELRREPGHEKLEPARKIHVGQAYALQRRVECGPIAVVVPLMVNKRLKS